MNAMQWVEVSENSCNGALYSMPPIYGKSGGFANSEPCNHDHAGQPMYWIYRRFDGKFYKSFGTRQQMDTATLDQTIIDRCAFVHSAMLDIINFSLNVFDLSELYPCQVGEILRHATPILYHYEILDWLYMYCGYGIRQEVMRTKARIENSIIDTANRHNLTIDQARTAHYALMNEQHPLNYQVAKSYGNACLMDFVKLVK